MYGSWLPSAILDTMQETAGKHCEILGLGKKQMKELGLIWVLSRAKIQMLKLPQHGDTVCVETYPTSCRHLFYPRSNVFRDENGEEIGYANSLWVLVDTNTRKITQSSEVQNRLPDTTQLKSRIGLPATVHALAGKIHEKKMITRFTDFDVNQHLNNTKYLDFCCDALGHDVMKQSHVMTFEVNYESEILPGSDVRTELVLNNDQFSILGYTNDMRHFAIGGQLSKRNA